MKFNDDWQKKVEKAAKGAIRDSVSDSQAELDKVHRQYAGKPVAQIKPALKRAWEKGGGKISDPELTDWAKLISDGQRIVLNLK